MSYFEVTSIFLLILILAVLILNLYVYKGFSKKKNNFIIRHGPRNFNKVALTFDDGPDPRYTSEILKILKRSKVKASFFLIATNVQKYPKLACQIAQEGHDIGNHSFNHGNLLVSRESALKKNVIKANEVITEITGIQPLMFRPPRGLYNKDMLKLVSDLGMKVVLWNLSSLDWRGTKPRKIAKIILEKARGGDIILFHDGGNLVYNREISHQNTVRALPQVIEGLVKRGYEIVPLSELLEVESE